MKLQRLILAFVLVATAITSYGQTDKEEKQEQQQERKAANQDKVDYNIFRRAILGTKEYSEERKKASTLQKTNKTSVKIVAVVDSLADNDDPKKLTGYIRQDIGDNSTNIYEVIFDRSIKKIISVRPTGEATEEDSDENASPKKNKAKQTAKTKKKTTDDDEDDEPEEKPSKKKQKEEDD